MLLILQPTRKTMLVGTRWLVAVANYSHKERRTSHDKQVHARAVSRNHGGRSIRWDGEQDQIVDDPQVNSLVSKPYRAPWKLEV